VVPIGSNYSTVVELGSRKGCKEERDRLLQELKEAECRIDMEVLLCMNKSDSEQLCMLRSKKQVLLEDIFALSVTN